MWMANENASRLKATATIGGSNNNKIKNMYSYRSEKYRINWSCCCLIIKWSHCHHHSDIRSIDRAIIIIIIIHTTSSNLTLGLSSIDHGSLIAIEVGNKVLTRIKLSNTASRWSLGNITCLKARAIWINVIVVLYKA